MKKPILPLLLILCMPLMGQDEPTELDLKALTELKKAAESGDPLAQKSLGVMYIAGSMRTEGHKWISKAAEQDDPEAQSLLGSILLTGIGIKQDFVAAHRWIRKAADQNYVHAQNNLGAMYAHGVGVQKNTKESAVWFRKAAELGNAPAQNSLGAYLLQRPKDIKEGRKEAAMWFRKAAENSSLPAMINLGRMYMMGEGVDKSEKEGFKWIRKAAELGHHQEAESRINLSFSSGYGVNEYIPFSQLLLGSLYERGTGTENNPLLAYAWYDIATSNGNANAKSNKDSISKKMTLEQITKAEALVKEMIKKNPKLIKKKE